MPLFRKSILKAAKVTLAMANNSKNNGLEVNFLLTSNSKIRLLNKRYRNKDNRFETRWENERRVNIR